MSDDAARSENTRRRQHREAAYVAFRTSELRASPIAGNFDAEHLKAVHAYLFQDLPEHRPGVVRADSDGWNKARALEGKGPSHVVRYLYRNVGRRITEILQAFGGAGAIDGLRLEAAARKLAGLYGDLDHAHAFYEGNSRTLREFTRELADAAGFMLDWTPGGAGTVPRNRLYVARDVAVLERTYPGLDERRAMETDDRGEYEAWIHLEGLREIQGEYTLAAIVRAGLRKRKAD